MQKNRLEIIGFSVSKNSILVYWVIALNFIMQKSFDWVDEIQRSETSPQPTGRGH